jgi:hypothetical protein
MEWSAGKMIPASCIDLDFRELEAALIKAHGNVSATAKALGVPSGDLRKLVWSTKLAETVFEQIEETIDRAQEVVMEALDSDDKLHKLQAAKTMLTQTTAGKRRGWGSGSAIGDEPVEAQPVTIKWLAN